MMSHRQAPNKELILLILLYDFIFLLVIGNGIGGDY